MNVDVRKRTARATIREARKRYQESGDALEVWHALTTAIGEGLSVPAWTRPYLFRVGAELWRLTWHDTPTEGKLDRAVAAAIQIRGRSGSNPFAKQRQDVHDFLVAFAVYETALKYPGQMDFRSAFKDVAESHPADCTLHKCRCKSWESVKRLWYRYALEVIPRSVIDRGCSLGADPTRPDAILRAVDRDNARRGAKSPKGV